MKVDLIKNFVLVSFISIIVTRLIPHPPNFTSTLALAFYLPVLFGRKFLLVAIVAFIIGDLIIGIHQLIFFTWGSLMLVGFFAKYFKKNYYRFLGVTLSCIMFFFISNFGVWLFSDIYNPNFQGLILCYYMALPFLQNTLISSLFFALAIELLININSAKIFIRKINPSYNFN